MGLIGSQFFSLPTITSIELKRHQFASASVSTQKAANFFTVLPLSSSNVLIQCI